MTDKKEIREAIQAGEAALASMERAREKLGSAKNWGFLICLEEEYSVPL